MFRVHGCLYLVAGHGAHEDGKEDGKDEGNKAHDVLRRHQFATLCEYVCVCEFVCCTVVWCAVV